MRLAIVSDTHDNVTNFTKVINWCNQEGIAVMLHCGDICNQSTIDEVAQVFKGEIHYVRGNGDFDLHDIPQARELELDGTKIFFNHYPDVAQTAAESGKYDLVFHGHTHKPWLERLSFSGGAAEKVQECLLANPGELAGQRFKPTFAVYDTETGKLELKILERLDGV